MDKRIKEFERWHKNGPGNAWKVECCKCGNIGFDTHWKDDKVYFTCKHCKYNLDPDDYEYGWIPNGTGKDFIRSLDEE